MRLVLVAAIALVCALVTVPLQAAPTEQQVGQLKTEADALSKQLDQVPRAPAGQGDKFASQHWQRMQDYMRSFPSMGCPGCGGMMNMMDGRATRGQGMSGSMMGGMMGHGMHGDGMMGCPMMGGPQGGWSMPHGMTPNAYHDQMARQMQTMRDAVAKAESAKDPAERERLLQQAWDGMYRNMQSMRGMGWMWAPHEQARQALPDGSSEGAQLVGKYCSQCHSPPSPSVHSAEEWLEVAERMRGHMSDAKGAGQGVEIPSPQELQTIVDYLGTHGHR